MKFFTSFFVLSSALLYMTVSGCQTGCTADFASIQAKLEQFANTCQQVQTVVPPAPFSVTPQVTTNVFTNVDAISSALVDVKSEIDLFAGVLTYEETQEVLQSLTKIQSSLQIGFEAVAGLPSIPPAPVQGGNGFGVDVNVDIGAKVEEFYSNFQAFTKSLLPICPPKSHPKVTKVCKTVKVPVQKCCSAYQKTCK